MATRPEKIKSPITKIVPVKTTEEEKVILQKNADKYTEGNLSEWLRLAGMNYNPKASDSKSNSKKH